MERFLEVEGSLKVELGRRSRSLDEMVWRSRDGWEIEEMLARMDAEKKRESEQGGRRGEAGRGYELRPLATFLLPACFLLLGVRYRDTEIDTHSYA